MPNFSTTNAAKSFRSMPGTCGSRLELVGLSIKARRGQEVTARRSCGAVGKARCGSGCAVCALARRFPVAKQRPSCFKMSRRERCGDSIKLLRLYSQVTCWRATSPYLTVNTLQTEYSFE